MILVTVGTQLPFPRLIRVLDEMAPSLGVRVVAQVGDNPDPIRNIEHHKSMDPRAFEALFKEADRIVAHAGIGTLLAAKKHGKPIIVFPRRAALGEHRNDHQLATARQLEGQDGVYVAYDEDQLSQFLGRENLVAASNARSASLEALHGALRDFVTSSRRSA